FRLQTGKVRTRIRFGVALAPDLVGGEDVLEEAALLFFRAVRDERWADEIEAESVHWCRRLRARVLLVEDHLFDERPAPASVFLRPMHREVPGFAKRPLPIA